MNLIEYKKFVNSRFTELIDLVGLPVSYIESATKLSASNFYNILMGNRYPSVGVMEKLGILLGLPLIRIFDPECILNDHVQKSEDLEDMLRAVAQLNENSFPVAKFIEENLFQSSIFDKPVSVAEVRKECSKPESKEFSSHNVSAALDSLVNKGKLEVTKKPMIKEDGSQGERMVKYYSRPKI